MYKFMTEFALRILNIIFRCNSCISVLTKVHTFHTLQMNPCTLKILRNTAFELEHQNCWFSFSKREKVFIWFLKPLNVSRTIQKPSKSRRNEPWGWNVRIWRLSTSCCWDTECVTERGNSNLESSSNPQKSFTQTWRGRDRATTQRQDRFLLIQSRRQRFLNATRLNIEFRNGTGVHISIQIVRNRLHELG